MRLQAAPFDADSHTAADWLEMKAILAPHGKASFVDIERAWEANRLSEDTDPAGGEEQFDEWLNERIAIMERRRELLGGAYPFEFSDNDTALRFIGSANVADGKAVYLLSLFLSVAPSTSIFEEKVPITPWMRNAFQVCSGWAASGAIEGSSYVFGWPRSDETSFLQALRLVFVDLMADGEVLPRNNAPAGASRREKDGGIDIVAWKERLDRASGKIHLFGQVASGADWRDKPISPYVDALSRQWLLQPWIHPPVQAMFIPFSIIPTGGASYTEQVRFFSATFGALFYREILPAYAEIGLKLEREGRLTCHRSDELPALVEKEQMFIELLRTAQTRA